MKSVYKAPALDKGLDIIELLAGRRTPVGLTEIALELGRTTTEIYRMLQVLEARGYIERSEPSGGYKITERLFEVGMRNAPKRNLHVAALPVMTKLADETFQSCHLTIVSDDSVVVVARVESPGAVSFAVKLGYRVPVLDSASGRVLFAFQTEQRRAQWRARLERTHGDTDELRRFLREASDVAQRGYALEPSRITEGINDIGAPVFGPHGDSAIASLTMPCLSHRYFVQGIDDFIPLVVEAAKKISRSLLRP
jgi:DNA-binding IclR family transcriptional regulator